MKLNQNKNVNLVITKFNVFVDFGKLVCPVLQMYLPYVSKHAFFSITFFLSLDHYRLPSSFKGSDFTNLFFLTKIRYVKRLLAGRFKV